MATAATSFQVQDTDRLTFTMFLAIVVHITLILGISFTLEPSSPIPQTLEVTLANYKSDQEITEADFLAQENQEGSGTLEEKALLSTTEIAEFQDNVINDTNPLEMDASSPKQSEQQLAAVQTSQSQLKIASEATQDFQLFNDLPDGPEQTLLERSLEIASLEAKLAREQQEYARRPKVHRLTSLSTMKAADAFYMNNWISEVERIGNLNYPAASKRDHIYGDVRLMVAIKPDGTVHDVQIMETSGHKVLDDAAIRIVRLASPFSPFSEDMKKQVDILEIIRTWQFRKTNYLSSSNG